MIFKKQIVILVTFFLLVSNLGLAFSVHYCDEEIESISINKAPTFQEKIDECCGIVEKDIECCNDKVIKAEIKSDQIIVKSVAFDIDFTTIADWKPQVFAPNNTLQQKDDSIYYCDAHAPPLYLLYSQYTFYC